jgi:outer membrane protein assembly factor BamB
MSWRNIVTSGRNLVVSAFLSAAFAAGALAQPGLTLAPGSTPPATAITVGGTGFARTEAVDIYFDTTDTVPVVTSLTGGFSGVRLTVPKDALPGTHWITAIGRREPQRVEGPHIAGPEHVLVGVGSFGVCALNAATGAKVWSFATVLPSTLFSSPAVANGVVYVGSFDGSVYALNARTGAKLWSFATGGAVVSSPAVANEVVYVGSDDNSLYAFDALTGGFLWGAETGGPVKSSPAVANGVVYVGSNDNNLDAVSVKGAPGGRAHPRAAAVAIASRPAAGAAQLD